MKLVHFHPFIVALRYIIPSAVDIAFVLFGNVDSAQELVKRMDAEDGDTLNCCCQTRWRPSVLLEPDFTAANN